MRTHKRPRKKLIMQKQEQDIATNTVFSNKSTACEQSRSFQNSSDSSGHHGQISQTKTITVTLFYKTLCQVIRTALSCSVTSAFSLFRTCISSSSCCLVISLSSRVWFKPDQVQHIEEFKQFFYFV